MVSSLCVDSQSRGLLMMCFVFSNGINEFPWVGCLRSAMARGEKMKFALGVAADAGQSRAWGAGRA
jgi:hypothetical protein